MQEFFSGIRREIADLFTPTPVYPPQSEHRVIPIPTKPFDERWADAEHLTLEEQIRFVEQEVFSLIKQGSLMHEGDNEIEQPGKDVYEFARQFLHIDQSEIKNSTLPEPIREYLTDLPLNTQVGWKKPALWLLDWWGYDQPQFKITVGTYLELRGDLPYWIHTSGWPRDEGRYKGNYREWILKAEAAPDHEYAKENSPLKATNGFARFNDLQSHLKEVGTFATVRELARFAGSVIETRTQNLPPKD